MPHAKAYVPIFLRLSAAPYQSTGHSHAVQSRASFPRSWRRAAIGYPPRSPLRGRSSVRLRRRHLSPHPC
eukprot:6058257-Pyramimonas_sp.AAC.1